MSKVKYHKHCRKHEAVAKVKRRLLKLIKQTEEIDFSLYITLTGVEDTDYRAVKYYIGSEYQNLYRKIGKEIEENKDSNEGYYTSRHLTRLTAIKELEDIVHYIINNYHQFTEIKKVEYVFAEPNGNVDEKKRQFLRHFELNPCIGFEKEYFAITGEKRKQLFGLTTTNQDLEGVEKIVIEYQ